MRKLALIGSLVALVASSACGPIQTTLEPKLSPLSCEGGFCRTRDGQIRDLDLQGISYIRRDDACYQGQVWGDQEYAVICPEDARYEALARLDEYSL